MKNECRLSKCRARDRKRANKRRISDTSAQIDIRLGKRHLQQRDTYASFSVERRHARIESVSNARRQRIAAQSPEERDARLQQLRTAREETIATESTERRQTCLQQLRSTQQQRIATESMEERQTRLQQLRTAQQQRIAAESTEEREARLQQLRTAQQQRIAAELTEERGPSSTAKDCSATEDCCRIHGGERSYIDNIEIGSITLKYQHFNHHNYSSHIYFAK